MRTQKTFILITLYAIDGTRVVTVSVAAPTDNADAVAEIKKIAESLRVFEPDYTKGK
ncbi:MAG: hypothetical protein HZA50_12475 [Planctomycetes bacterium]|nr:hypothetical protein [Planctomycetota bacterium]